MTQSGQPRQQNVRIGVHVDAKGKSDVDDLLDAVRELLRFANTGIGTAVRRRLADIIRQQIIEAATSAAEDIKSSSAGQAVTGAAGAAGAAASAGVAGVRRATASTRQQASDFIHRRQRHIEGRINTLTEQYNAEQQQYIAAIRAFQQLEKQTADPRRLTPAYEHARTLGAQRDATQDRIRTLQAELAQQTPLGRVAAGARGLTDRINEFSGATAEDISAVNQQVERTERVTNRWSQAGERVRRLLFGSRGAKPTIDGLKSVVTTLREAGGENQTFEQRTEKVRVALTQFKDTMLTSEHVMRALIASTVLLSGNMLGVGAGMQVALLGMNTILPITDRMGGSLSGVGKAALFVGRGMLQLALRYGHVILVVANLLSLFVDFNKSFTRYREIEVYRQQIKALDRDLETLNERQTQRAINRGTGQFGFAAIQDAQIEALRLGLADDGVDTRAVEQIQALSTSTKTDLRSSLAAIAPVLHNYNLEIGDALKATNALNALYHRGGASLDVGRNLFGQSGFSASRAGVSIEELTAFFNVAYNQSAGNVNSALTLVRNTIEALASPATSQRLSELGVELEDGLLPALRSIGEELNTAQLENLLGTPASLHVQQAVQSLDQIDVQLEKMQDQLQVWRDAYNDVTTLNGAWEQLNVTLNQTGNSLAGVLEKLQLPAIIGLVDALLNLPNGNDIGPEEFIRRENILGKDVVTHFAKLSLDEIAGLGTLQDFSGKALPYADVQELVDQIASGQGTFIPDPSLVSLVNTPVRLPRQGELIENTLSAAELLKRQNLLKLINFDSNSLQTRIDIAANGLSLPEQSRLINEAAATLSVSEDLQNILEQLDPDRPLQDLVRQYNQNKPASPQDRLVTNQLFRSILQDLAAVPDNPIPDPVQVATRAELLNERLTRENNRRQRRLGVDPFSLLAYQLDVADRNRDVSLADIQADPEVTRAFRIRQQQAREDELRRVQTQADITASEVATFSAPRLEQVLATERVRAAARDLPFGPEEIALITQTVTDRLQIENFRRLRDGSHNLQRLQQQQRLLNDESPDAYFQRLRLDAELQAISEGRIDAAGRAQVPVTELAQLQDLADEQFRLQRSEIRQQYYDDERDYTVAATQRAGPLRDQAILRDQLVRSNLPQTEIDLQLLAAAASSDAQQALRSRDALDSITDTTEQIQQQLALHGQTLAVEEQLLRLRQDGIPVTEEITAAIERQVQLTEQLAKQQQVVQAIERSLRGGINDAVNGLVLGTQTWGEALQQLSVGILSQIQQQIIDITIAQPIASGVGNLVTGIVGGLLGGGPQWGPIPPLPPLAAAAGSGALAASAVGGTTIVQNFATPPTVPQLAAARLAFAGESDQYQRRQQATALY